MTVSRVLIIYITPWKLLSTLNFCLVLFCFLCLKLSVNILFYVRVIFLILPYPVVFFFVYFQYGTLYKSLPFFLWCMTVRDAEFFFLITLSLRKTILMFTTIKPCKRIEFRLLSVEARSTNTTIRCRKRKEALTE